MLLGVHGRMADGGAVGGLRRWRSSGGSGRGLSMLVRVHTWGGGSGRGQSMLARSSAAGGF